MILSIIVTLILLYFGIWCAKECRRRWILRKIPAPPSHWLIGHAICFVNNPPERIFDFIREFAQNCWPIYRLSTPYLVSVNILHPKDFEIVLSQMKHLSKSNAYSFLHNWLGNGLLTSTGEKWQTRRKILTPGFHFRILQQFLAVFHEETDNLLKQIEKKCSGSSLDVIPLISQMALQSIMETAMGMKNDDESEKIQYRNCIYKMGKIFMARISKPWLKPSFTFFLSKEGSQERSAVNFMHNFTLKVIKDRENQILNSNHQKMNTETSYSGRKVSRMLDILIEAKINDKSIDIQGVREEVDTFMFEGHDTTSSAICFALLTLANHPDIQNEVRKEIQEIIGTNKTPSYNDLQELAYTERVIKETLRLFPSVPFIARLASEDFVTYTGYEVPKGTIINLHIFDLHRDPRIYENPFKFDPDRFLPENSANRHPFAYLPFSAGPRNCIGQRFALLEIKAVLCGVLRKFNLEKVDNLEDIKFITDLILRPKSKIKIKFVPRDNV